MLVLGLVDADQAHWDYSKGDAFFSSDRDSGASTPPESGLREAVSIESRCGALGRSTSLRSGSHSTLGVESIASLAGSTGGIGERTWRLRAVTARAGERFFMVSSSGDPAQG